VEVVVVKKVLGTVVVVKKIEDVEERILVTEEERILFGAENKNLEI